MPDKKHTTLSGITPHQLIHLEQLALDLIGTRSVSALIRYIADHGIVTREAWGTASTNTLEVVNTLAVVKTWKEVGPADGN